MWQEVKRNVLQEVCKYVCSRSTHITGIRHVWHKVSMRVKRLVCVVEGNHVW